VRRGVHEENVASIVAWFHAAGQDNDHGALGVESHT
jgi:hypothetical protein